MVQSAKENGDLEDGGEAEHRPPERLRSVGGEVVSGRGRYSERAWDVPEAPYVPDRGESRE